MGLQLGTCITALALAAALSGCASDQMNTAATATSTGRDAWDASTAPIAGGVRDPASVASGADGSTASDTGPGRTPGP